MSGVCYFARLGFQRADMDGFEISVERWGDGLAIRLPGAMVDVLKVTEGSVIRVEVGGPTQLRVSHRNRFDRTMFLERLDRLHQRMPQSVPVVELIRNAERY